MRNVSQGPVEWFVKSIQKHLPKQTYTDTEKRSQGWRENNLPDSQVKIITHEEPQDTSHTCEELKGTYSGTTECRRMQQPLEGSLGKGLNSSATGAWVKMLLPHWHSLPPSPSKALCSVSHAVSLAVSQLLENSPDKSPDSCHFPPSWNGSSSSCIMLPTPQWAWHKYKTHKAFCLLVACPPLTLMSRTHLTDTADRTGQVLPTATHCTISYLSHSFQGMGSSPEQRLLFPTFCTQPGQQSFQKTELNLTANTHVEHFPCSHTRMQNYLPISQAQNTHISVPISQRSHEMQCPESPEPSQAALTWGHGTHRLELGPGCSGVNN